MSWIYIWKRIFDELIGIQSCNQAKSSEHNVLWKKNTEFLIMCIATLFNLATFISKNVVKKWWKPFDSTTVNKQKLIWLYQEKRCVAFCRHHHLQTKRSNEEKSWFFLSLTLWEHINKSAKKVEKLYFLVGSTGT